MPFLPRMLEVRSCAPLPLSSRYSITQRQQCIPFCIFGWSVRSLPYQIFKRASSTYDMRGENGRRRWTMIWQYTLLYSIMLNVKWFKSQVLQLTQQTHIDEVTIEFTETRLRLHFHCHPPSQPSDAVSASVRMSAASSVSIISQHSTF